MGKNQGLIQKLKIFAKLHFDITFPITDKTDVKGNDAHDLYKWAKKNYGNSTIPKWNFHKIIINKNGKVSKTFTSITNPSSQKFIAAIDNIITDCILE